MATQTLTYNQFTKGLITEASPLTFPENASLDEDNCVLSIKGSRRRRNGLDVEANAVFNETGVASSSLEQAAISSGEWLTVSGNSSRNLVVIQIEGTLHFYEAGSVPLSAGKKVFTQSLLPFRKELNDDYKSSPVFFASGKGALFVVGAAINPFYITSPAPTSFTSELITPLIRDFEGVDDGLDVEERPEDLTDNHKYNLYNQSWREAKGDEDKFISKYKTDTGFYPSNNLIWYAGKDGNDDFKPSLLDKTQFGNTPAPKGHYIIEAFTKNRTEVSGISVTPSNETTLERPEAAAFYAGRLWLGGDKGKIYFSQIIKDDFSNVGNFYQQADPTSEEDPDLVDTDGGVVDIPDAGRVVSLIEVGPSILVLCTNGVWIVKGTDGGFKATDFSTKKISTIGALSSSSVVNVEGVPVWFGDTGIYTISLDQITGNEALQNLSRSTIQSFYDEIPAESKLKATGVYDAARKVVTWLYKSLDNTSNIVYNYDKVLNLDAELGAFYTYTISSIEESDTPFLAGVFKTPVLTSVTREDTVVVNDVTVVVGLDDVTIQQTEEVASDTFVHYLIVEPDATNSLHTFGQFNNNGFVDFEYYDNIGADFTSYVVTGYDTAQDASIKKQAPYVDCYFERTEETYVLNNEGGLDLDKPSSCFMSVTWDWTDLIDVQRTQTPRQVYRHLRNFTPSGAGDTFANGYPVVVTSNRVRGNGRALSIRFESESGKDFVLLGWSVVYKGNPRR